MPKLFSALVVTFAFVALSAAPASAHWLHHQCKQCDRCGTFYVRPYNAFSPVAYGNITFAGYTMPGYGFGGPGGAGSGCDTGAPSQDPSGTTLAPGAPLPNAVETEVSDPTSDIPMGRRGFRRIQNGNRRFNLRNGPMVPMAEIPAQYLDN
jgi:hypothetical protein